MASPTTVLGWRPGGELDVVADDVAEGRQPALADDLARIARVDDEPHPWKLGWA